MVTYSKEFLEESIGIYLRAAKWMVRQVREVREKGKDDTFQMDQLKSCVKLAEHYNVMLERDYGEKV